MAHQARFKKFFIPFLFLPKRFTHQGTNNSCIGESRIHKGLVLGVYTDDSDREMSKFTPTAERYDAMVSGKLLELLRASGPMPKKGTARLFYNVDSEYSAVAVAALGHPCIGYDAVECRDEGKEAIRIAAAIGCRSLQDIEVVKISVEGFGHAESAAEGASLGIWLYQDIKNKKNQICIPHLDLYDDCDDIGWITGLQKAAAQNLARQLTDTPSNLLTPTIFAQSAVEILCKSGVNVEVKVQGWAETQKMGAFLGVAKGSCEAPIFLEISYYGAPYDERPIVLIGTGVTFDSGGVCLKEPHDMLPMRGNMTGAAIVIATARALAELRLPLNLRGLIPLCENMPGCSALKPGDIVTAMNGKNILIENTDCEGRLMLADTLFYAQNFWPRFVIDIGSLTKDVRRTVGRSATGVFTNSDALWNNINNAAIHTGDRVWRFPLWEYYKRQVSDSTSVDYKNVGRGQGGGACKAAAFLKEFVPCGEWIHLDNYGVLESNGKEEVYLQKGMSGRPTRTVIEFISQLVCKKCE